MTWGQIRLACQKKGEEIDLDNLDQWIQDRYATILDAHPWKALETDGTLTVNAAGTAGTPCILKLPAGCKILQEVTNPTLATPLRPYTQTEMNMLYPARPDVGQPYIYSMAEDSSDNPPVHQVEVYPIPGGAGFVSLTLPIRYIAIPANFSPSTTTASPLPWIPPRLIINGVRADILAQQEKWDGMEAFENLFSAGIQDLVRTDLAREPNSRLAQADRYNSPKLPAGNR